MKSLCGAALVAACLAMSAPALAQSNTPAPASGSGWGGAVEIGVGGVQRAGAAAGARITRSGGDRISWFVRATWFADSVSRRRLSMADSIARFTSSTRGVSMTSDVKVPAWYAGLGGTWRLRKGPGWYPTVFVEGGVARVTFQPAFRVNGNDVTGNLRAYGITLGRDLAGNTTKAAFGGGLGLVVPRGRWQVEAQARFLQIQTPAESSRAASLTAGIGYRF